MPAPAVLVAVCLGLAACSGASTVEHEPVPKAEPSAYQLDVVRSARAIEGARAGEEAQPTSWLRIAGVAAREIEHARLTGEYATYASALSACERAFENAPDGSGPMTICAGVELAVHRVEPARAKVERALSVIVLSTEKRVQQHLLMADIHMGGGDFDAALVSLDAAKALLPNDYGLLIRQAYYLWFTGDPAEADELLERASMGRISDRNAAWLGLQRGLLALEYGDAEQALAHFDAAEERFSGWWLIREHRAEALARLDREAEARVIFEQLARSPGFPEHLDALSAVAEPRDASRLRREAGEGHQQRMELLESAAIGHALDHYLMYGTPEEALSLAQRNHAMRPGPDSKTKLAQALVRAGRVAEARTFIEQALRGAASRPALHATAYWVFLAAGDQAAAERERARVQDESAVDRLSWMRLVAEP